MTTACNDSQILEHCNINVQSLVSAWAVPMAGCLSGVSTCPFLGERLRELMGMAGLTRHWKDPVLPSFLWPSSPPHHQS